MQPVPNLCSLKIQEQVVPDKLMNALVAANVIGSDKKIRKEKIPKGPAPCLTNKQITEFTNLLLKPVEILPSFTLPAWKVLRRIQKLIALEGLSSQDFLRCVGSAKSDVIESDPDYTKNLIENLAGKKINAHFFSQFLPTNPQKCKDLDIRLYLPESDAAKNLMLKAKLIEYLVKKVCKKMSLEMQAKSRNDIYEMISRRINKKFCNPYDDPIKAPGGNRFMLLSLGNKEFSLDVICAQHLKRTKVLSPDGGELPFNIVRLNPTIEGNARITLTHLPFSQLPSNKIAEFEPPVLCPGSSDDLFYEVILDRFLHIVHFPDMLTMDHDGWFKLNQYYSQGYRTYEDEIKLFEKVFIWANGSSNISEKIALKLKEFASKHFDNEPIGVLTYYLNAMMSLYRMGHVDKISIILKEFQNAFQNLECFPDSISLPLSYLKANPEDFEAFIYLLQCTITAEVQEAELSTFQTMNSGKSAIQCSVADEKGKKFTLMIPFTLGNPLPKNLLDLCEKYPFYRTYLRRQLQIVFKETDDDQTLFWKLLKFKTSFEKHPWAYYDAPTQKLNQLLTAIDKIIAAKSTSKFDLNDLLWSYITLLIDEYKNEPDFDEAKIVDVAKKTTQAMLSENLRHNSAKEKFKEQLTPLLPRMLKTLHQQKNGAVILELCRSLKIHGVAISETAETIQAIVYAHSETLAKKQLSSDCLCEFTKMINSGETILKLLDSKEQIVLLESFKSFFLVLLSRNEADSAIKLLPSLKGCHVDIYVECFQQILLHCETKINDPKWLETTCNLLTEEKWQEPRLMFPEICKRVAEKTVESSLVDGTNTLPLHQIFSLLRQYSFCKGRFWLAFMGRLSFNKDKMLLEESWSFFQSAILKRQLFETDNQAEQDSRYYSQAWLYGIKLLKKYLPRKLSEITRDFENISPHLEAMQNPSDCTILQKELVPTGTVEELTEEIELLVLQTLDDLIERNPKSETYSALFEKLYQKHQTKPPKNQARCIEFATIKILSHSNETEKLRSACIRMKAYIGGKHANEELNTYPILERIFLKIDRILVSGDPTSAEIIRELFENLYAGNFSHPEEIFEVFAKQEHTSLLKCAVDLLGWTILGDQRKKTKHGVSPSSVLRVLTLMMDVEHPLSKEYNESSVLGILSNSFVVNLLKDDERAPMWKKILTRKLKYVLTCPKESLKDEILKIIDMFRQAPDIITYDPEMQNMFMDILERMITYDFSEGVFYEALFLHSALGKFSDLDKYPFIRAPEFYKSPSVFSIMIPNFKAPYFSNPKITAAFVDFESRWLSRLFLHCLKMDWVNTPEVIPFLSYFESRFCMFGACKRHSLENVQKIRGLIDNYFKCVISKPKSPSIETIFIRNAIPTICKEFEDLYKEDKLPLNRYWIYKGIIEQLLPDSTSKSSGQSPLKSTPKVEVIKWTLECIRTSPAGYNISYAFSFLRQLMDHEVFEDDFDALNEVLNCLFVQLSGNSTGIITGQTIELTLAHFNEMLRWVLFTCHRSFRRRNVETDKAILESVTLMLKCLPSIAKSFKCNGSDQNQPLVGYLQFLKQLESLSIPIIALTGIQALISLRTDIMPDVIEEIKSHMENGSPNIAKVLGMRFISLMFSSELKYLPVDKIDLSIITLKFLVEMLKAYPKESPHHTEMFNLALQLKNLANLKGIFLQAHMDQIEDAFQSPSSV